MTDQNEPETQEPETLQQAPEQSPPPAAEPEPIPFRAAMVVDGRVDNVVMVTALDAIEGVQLVASDTAAIGDLYVDGEFSPAPAPPLPVPKSITRYQMRRVLRARDLYDTVEQAVMAAGVDARDGWEAANAIQRDDPHVIALMAAIGQTPQQVDALFIEGAAL